MINYNKCLLIVFTLFFIIGTACNNDKDIVNDNPNNRVSNTTIPNVNTSNSANGVVLNDLSVPFTTVDSMFSIVKIAPIPDHFPSKVRSSFNRYTQVVMPNGKPINIYAQNKISDAQMIQVRNMLIFWLTNIPNSYYGADKIAVANKMGDNRATLMLLNGSDGDTQPPSLNAQPLYETEIVVPGSAWYINNDFEHRDATFEEVLHLVHDTGIGVDGDNTQPGALPNFQTEIRIATNNAIANNFQIWPITAKTDSDVKSWYNELAAENSLSQEYLAAVIDSYYGLWGPFQETDGGMWGLYIAKNRADIESKDPMGYALMMRFFSPYLTYNAQLDSGFAGTFTMTFDPNTPYTHKSQYLLHATLTGTNNANLTGNDQGNHLSGNAGDNVLDGLEGIDTAVYPGKASMYTITKNSDGTITVVGDGTDTLINIEEIIFADGV